jgi:EmrB/QacA subfamily drug resistance transporter
MRQHLLFAIVSITNMTASMGGTVVAVAFPNIVTSFDTSLIMAGWVLGANQLACTIGMPLMGKIGDAYGNKSTSILCICLFTFGSLFCALAPNIELLIIFRFIQGIAVGGFLPTSASIVSDQFGNRRQRYIGLLASVNAAGSIIGPNLGGWLTTAFGWRSTFWVFVPFGVLTLIAVLILVPKASGKVSQLDILGAGLLTSIISVFMIGISLMGNTQQGVPWIQGGLFFAAGIILLVIFFKRQVRVKNPIIDIEILQEKRFLANNVYNFVLGVALLAITGFIPLYAVSVFGMSTFDSGFVMTPRSIGALVASIIASLYLIRWGYRKPMVIGTVVTAASFLIMSIVNSNTILFGWQINGFVLLSLILLMNGIAWGITTPAANNACIELMPERVGTIVGVRGMFRQLGASIGISVITLGLNNSSNIQQGFFIVLIGTALIMLLSLPLIFRMPENAGVMPIIKGSK